MLNIGLCKGGSIKVADDGTIQIVQPFGKILWQAPAATIASFTSQPGLLNALNITIQTNQGTYYRAETVSAANFAKLQAVFPRVPVQVAGKEWYMNPASLTHVATYTKERDMQREVALVAQHGWVPQAQSTQQGTSSAAKVIGGALLAGPIGALAGAASKSRGSITVTYVRSPQWLASQHRV